MNGRDIPRASPSLTDEQLRQRHEYMLLSPLPPGRLDECDACGREYPIIEGVRYQRPRKGSPFPELHPGYYCGRCDGPEGHV